MQINGKEYRLVPVEPTEEIEQAAANYLDACVKAHGLWKAMLAAAPTPEATEAAQDALDASRYRWLRNYEVDSYLAGGSKEELDAAIDAAIAAGGEDG